MYEDLYIESELENKFEEFSDDIIREAIEGDIIINKQELEELKEEYENKEYWNYCFYCDAMR